jgi:predicted nucleic acid-binding protein
MPSVGVAAVIVDAGPIIAWLNRGDRYHEWTKARFAALVPPLLTCEAVLSEAAHVLRRARGSGSEVVALVHRGVFHIPFALEAEAEAIERLMRRYRTLPMSLADACLVRMSELHPRSRVFTTDSDFTIYRRNGRQVVPLLAPPDR